MYFVYVLADGVLVQHKHATRAAARAQVRTINNNIFLRDWQAKGVSSQGVRL